MSYTQRCLTHMGSRDFTCSKYRDKKKKIWKHSTWYCSHILYVTMHKSDVLLQWLTLKVNEHGQLTHFHFSIYSFINLFYLILHLILKVYPDPVSGCKVNSMWVYCTISVFSCSCQCVCVCAHRGQCLWGEHLQWGQRLWEWLNLLQTKWRCCMIPYNYISCDCVSGCNCSCCMKVLKWCNQYLYFLGRFNCLDWF